MDYQANYNQYGSSLYVCYVVYFASVVHGRRGENLGLRVVILSGGTGTNSHCTYCIPLIPGVL